MIEAEQLTKRYGPVTAVDHLTFTPHVCGGHMSGAVDTPRYQLGVLWV